MASEMVFDLSGIQNYEQVCALTHPDNAEVYGFEAGQKYLNPVTDALIAMTVPCLLREITVKNAREFYLRVHFWEQVHGTMLSTRDQKGHHKVDRPITEADVRQHIGLKTNSSNGSAMQFAAMMFRKFVAVTERHEEQATEQALHESFERVKEFVKESDITIFGVTTASVDADAARLDR